MTRWLLLLIAGLLVLPADAGWRDGWRKKKAPEEAATLPPEADKIATHTSATPAADEDDETFFGDPGESVSAHPATPQKPKGGADGTARTDAVVDDAEEEEFNRRLSDLSQKSPAKAEEAKATRRTKKTVSGEKSTPRQRVPTPADLAREARERAAQASPRAALKPGDLVWECAALCFFALFGVVYVFGRKANDRIAIGWAEAIEDLLTKQFASVATEDGLTKLSPAEYCIYASGRDNCEWMQATLQLRARQDLYQILASLIAPVPDRLIVDVGLCEPDMADPYVLALLDRRVERKYIEEHAELRDRTVPASTADIKGLAESVHALAEVKELPGLLLNKELQASLALCAGSFEALHVTDTLPADWNLPMGATRVIRFIFRLPKDVGGDGAGAAVAGGTKLMVMTDLLRVVLLSADRLARTRLPQAIKEKIKEAREREASRREGHAKRQELGQQKRAERLAALKERAPLADREAQRKREEKDARKAAKAKGPKAKMKRT
jgi:hypothetical protein